jgi:hypothetical protein
MRLRRVKSMAMPDVLRRALACTGARKQLAPAPGGFGIRHVDRVGVEREPARSQTRDGDEIAGAVVEF